MQLDTKDGISWSVLGNAYLAHFFSVSQNPRTLKQAMTAYKQAEKDIIALNTPELHHNKGIVSYERFLFAYRPITSEDKVSVSLNYIYSVTSHLVINRARKNI